MHIPRMSRAEIASDLLASLEHLQVDTIDLYWLHRDDPARPVDEIVESLNEHVKAGRIRYFGCSNWRAERIRAAQEYAAAHGLQGFAGDQMMWSFAAMDPTRIADQTLVCDGRYTEGIPHAEPDGGYPLFLAGRRVIPEDGAGKIERPRADVPCA